MRTLLIIALLTVAGYFASGYSSFSTSRVASFLDQLEDDINHGRTDAACDKIGEQIEFSQTDNTNGRERATAGGKAELCRQFARTAAFYKTAPIADRHFKSDISVKRDLRHWTSAQIAYDEHHEIEFFPAHNKIRTIAHQRMTLEKKGDSFLVTRWTASIELE